MTEDPKIRKNTQDSESSYVLNPERFIEDGRTTLMIKNIPNKYSLDLLLEDLN